MSLFSKKYPNTAKFEAKQEALRTDYDRFCQYSNSEELKHINELTTLVNSDTFKNKVQKLKTERFKDTEEFTQLKKYKELKGSSYIRKYFKYLKADIPNKLLTIEKSGKLERLEELKKFVSNPSFEIIRKEKGFKKTEEYQKLKEYKSLKKDKDLRFYNKQKHSSNYENYKSVDGSQQLKEYNELKKLVNSDQFIAYKKEMEDKGRFKKSKEFASLIEHKKLINSSDYINYEKLKSKNPFREIEKWQPSFEDDFKAPKLNGSKWITGYYWGKALLSKSYVLDNERQFFKDSNIKSNGSGLQLSTQSESTQGIAWHPTKGFTPKTFDYTSALISTGQSFRQLYGKFEAKVKVDHTFPVHHAFWMVGEQMAPQIDIFRFNDKSPKIINTGIHILKNNQAVQLTTSVNGGRFNNDYYIYSLEWTKEKLSWFINGVKVHEQTNNIPNEQMYLVFSSHITEEIEELKQPSHMNIEWIKCYQLKN